jgi:hypothetical protein
MIDRCVAHTIVLIALAFTGCAGGGRPVPSAGRPADCSRAERFTATRHASGGEVRPADPMLARLEPLVGTWRGDTRGEPGTGKVERTYRFSLRGRYLEVENRSVYPPTEGKPAGEVHEDVGFYSHDKARKTLVMRQFHVEGFVSHYVLARSDGGTFVFLSETIENVPAGFRARETLRLVGQDRLEESFELAPPGQEFSVYSTSSMTRAETDALAR